MLLPVNAFASWNNSTLEMEGIKLYEKLAPKYRTYKSSGDIRDLSSNAKLV